MASFHPIGIHSGSEYAPASFLLRLGRREISVYRDLRKRYYTVNPVLDCSTGSECGYVEIVLLRRWLIILSKARQG
ncbi:hypothetical protein [Herminiimonas sp. CN]|uniref:hypothetical protein n=1 Tax=Herminiimonas sp. CN TaxID=1349818 RepID=UPI0009DE88F5|nr:hypothetical protein [Herminiimonas sp. CN]